MKIYWHKGRKNIIGKNVRLLRKNAKLTQEQLAIEVQLLGFEFERIAIVRIEKGNRFVADYEVLALAQALNVSVGTLYENIDFS